MQVLFKNMIAGYTGIQDDCVMYYSRRFNKVIIRRRPQFHKTARMETFKAVMANLKLLQPTQAYRDDLRTYCTQYNIQRHRYSNDITWNNIWQKLMWMLARVYGTDLQTITREQIYLLDLPCISVRKAVIAGLLPRVQGYEDMTAEM